MMFTTKAPAATLAALPALTGPAPSSSDSYPFSAASRQIHPLGPEEFGYVEEEFFVSGTAHIYGAGTEGNPVAEETDVPYINRILVRRPADPATASGTVWVDIMNASNRFVVEDHWRRTWNHWLAEGDTYVGVTSKPIQIAALKNFDSARYAPLTWDLP